MRAFEGFEAALREGGQQCVTAGAASPALVLIGVVRRMETPGPSTGH